jgi:hypothetical protein
MFPLFLHAFENPEPLSTLNMLNTFQFQIHLMLGALHRTTEGERRKWGGDTECAVTAKCMYFWSRIGKCINYYRILCPNNF